jgi:hypothetical protein
VTPQIALWTVLTMAAGLGFGVAQWLRRRGLRRHMSVLMALVVGMGAWLGDGHPMSRHACSAIAFGFVIEWFITDRKTIQWRSPMMLALGSFTLFIILAELAHDVIPGVPRAVGLALAYGAAASFLVLIGSIFWEFVGAFRLPIDKPPLKL